MSEDARTQDTRTEDTRIARILTTVKTIALVGCSPKPYRPSHRVAAFRKGLGSRVFPVNPGQPGQDGGLGGVGRGAWAEVAPVELGDLFRRSEEVGLGGDEAIATGAKVIWMQLGVEDASAAARAEAAVWRIGWMNMAFTLAVSVVFFFLHDELVALFTDDAQVIAIGGDKLARGLTLEGLCVSYFIRTTRMYDTLMQMGRWFGYRPGYLDLCRLYTSPDLVRWFCHIADASEELREEFDFMAKASLTPEQYGLKVKSHEILTVTSPLKMRNSQTHHLQRLAHVQPVAPGVQLRHRPRAPHPGI